MFTPTPPTDLAPQGHGVGLSPGDSGRGRGHPEDKPQTQEKHKTEKGRWGCPLPTRLSAGGADHEAGRMGPLMGKWGLPDFSSSLFFSPSFIHRNLFFRPLFLLPPTFLSLSHTPTFNYSVSLSHTSLAPLSLFPHPTYMLWNLWRRQPCPTRDAKNGDTTGQRTWATPPVHPHPAPPDGFITSYAAHLKPIESLGGRVSDSDIYLGGSFCYFREFLTGLWGWTFFFFFLRKE